jgi:hypothetical protein
MQIKLWTYNNSYQIMKIALIQCWLCLVFIVPKSNPEPVSVIILKNEVFPHKWGLCLSHVVLAEVYTSVIINFILWALPPCLLSFCLYVKKNATDGASPNSADKKWGFIEVYIIICLLTQAQHSLTKIKNKTLRTKENSWHFNAIHEFWIYIVWKDNIPI